MAHRANTLGDYLRARREQVRPEDVGLAAGPRRRVPGLRREELATLAGISAAYYPRLEQCRDTHPSAQVKHPRFHAHLVTCDGVLSGVESSVVLGLGFCRRASTEAVYQPLFVVLSSPTPT